METVNEKANIDYKDDLRQALIVSRYETMKFFSGKKILIFGIINILILALMTVLIFAFDIESPTPEIPNNIFCIELYLSVSSYLMLFGATLFSAGSLVSEFEERTSLLLFTKPIRKISIFLGKFLAAYVLNLMFLIMYYVIATVAVMVKFGTFTPEIFASIGYCAAYIFALTGIAMLFSALMKKSSSASILTFLFILLVPSIIGVIIQIVTISSGGDAPDMWYILNSASQSVATCLEGPVENGFRDVIVMLLWGLGPAVGAYYLFRKREV